MTRCSKCKFGNLINAGTWERPTWIMECNVNRDEPDYLRLTEAEKEDLPCDLYVPNLCDDDAA